MKPDPTNSARQRAYKARQKAKGLTEVRGIYAPAAEHARIRSEARESLKTPPAR